MHRLLRWLRQSLILGKQCFSILEKCSSRAIGKALSLVTLAGFVSAQASGCAHESAGQHENGALDPSQQKGDARANQTTATDNARSETANDQRLKSLILELRQEGIANEEVLSAIARVPRHVFVPELFKASSYDNGPLPIGNGQTISQPYIVAYMTESLDLKPGDRVLEVGTGSGYQAAVLAQLVEHVYSIEIIPELAERARRTLRQIGINNVQVKVGDGYKGWPEEAPFDAIIITAAPPEIPNALVEQLRPGGRLIAPVGKDDMQWLVKITRDKDKVRKETLLPVRFVPMVPAK